MSHVKKYRLATIEVILVITFIMMGGFSVMREASAQIKGVTIGYRPSIPYASTTVLTAFGDNTIYSLLSDSTATGSFLKFQRMNASGVYRDIFVIDHEGTITTTGRVLGSNNYWKLDGSNLYASTTSWNVGIGTTNPQRLLEVAGSNGNATPLSLYRPGCNWTGCGLAQEFALQDAANNRKVFATLGAGITTPTAATEDGFLYFSTIKAGTLTEGMRLNKDGNVGIGLTNPVAPLEIKDYTWSAASVRPTVLKLDSYTDANNEGPFLDFTSRWAGGYQSWVVGRIGGVYDSVVGNGGSLVFYTNYGTGANDTTLREQVRINPNGNFGIGTTNPATKAHIYDATSGPILTMSGLDANYRGLTIKNTSDVEQWFTGNNTSNNFVVRRSGTTDYLTVASNGNIGIGTSSPMARLQVAGSLVANYAAINLTPNGDFETGSFSGFSGFNGIESADSKDGKYSAYNDTASSAGFGTEFIPVDTNGYLYLEGWFKSVGASGLSMIYFGTVAYDANKGYLAGNGGSYGYCAASGANVPNTWTKYTCTLHGEGTDTYQFPVGTRYIKPLFLFNYQGGSGYKVLVDGIKYSFQAEEYTQPGNLAIFARAGQGNVGIGTTNPTTKLYVSNGTNEVINVGGGRILNLAIVPQADSEAVSKKYLHDNFNSTSTSFWVSSSPNNINNTNSGNVGIGTTNPDTKLQIQGALKLQNLASSSPDTNFRRIINVVSYQGGGVDRTGILVIKLPTPLAHSMGKINISGWSYGKAWDLSVSAYMYPGSGWTSLGGTVVTGNPPFNLSDIRLVADTTANTFYILLGSATTNYGYYASVGVDVDSYYSNNLPSTGWDIYIAASNPTFNVSATPAVSLYGSSNALISGNAGIGTTAPQAKTEIDGGTTSSDILKITESVVTGGLTGGNALLFLRGSAMDSNGYFINAYDGGSGLYRFVVRGDGNVGIGSSSPVAKLAVKDGTGNVIYTGGGQVSGLPTVQTQDDQAVSRKYLHDNFNATSTSFWAGSLAGNINSANTGNVGIGTSSPSLKLDVMTGVTPYAAMRVGYPNSSLGMYLGRVSTSGYYAYIGDSYYQDSNNWRAPSTTGSAIRFKDAGGIGFFLDSGLTANTNYVPAERLTITAAGNVGIAATNPGHKLEVNGNILNNGILYQYTSLGQASAAHGISWYQPSYTTWFDYMAPAGSTNAPSGTAAPSDAPAGVTSWARRFNIESSGTYGWLFESGVNGAGNAPTVKFAINASSGTFHATGNGIIDGSVGIGTTNPQGRLHVGDTAYSTLNSGYKFNMFGPVNIMQRDNGTDSYVVNNAFFNSGNQWQRVLGGGAGRIGWNSDAVGAMDFKVAPTGIAGSTFSWVNAMTILGDGNVGIGTTAPGAKLEVSGNIRTSPNGALPNLVFDSNDSGDNWTSQGAYISLGESGALGAAALHLTYIGDGTSYIGSGAVTSGIPAQSYLRFAYNSKNIYTDSNIQNAATGISYFMGNVGIGTTNPAAKTEIDGGNVPGSDILKITESVATNGLTGGKALLFLRGSAMDSNGYFINAYDGGSGLYRFVVRGDGNVGIGTSSPRVSLDLATTSVTDRIHVSGGYVAGLASTPTRADQAVPLGYLQNNYSPVPGGVNGQTLRHSGTGWAANSALFNDGTNVGIGTTNPGTTLDVSGTLRATGHASPTSGAGVEIDYGAYGANIGRLLAYDRTNTVRKDFVFDALNVRFASNDGTERMRIASTGNVGIGTTNPAAKLEVNGNLTLSGTGKLTANTIDPPYLIDGRKYATYMAGMTGVKEETTGVVKLRLAADKSYYYHVLDIGQAEEGSDLWLFGRTANLQRNGLNAVTVLLAPSFSGRVWYEKDSAKQLITIKASGLRAKNNLEVSYRLSAPRFDTEEYGNRRPDSDPHEGINLDKLLK